MRRRAPFALAVLVAIVGMGLLGHDAYLQVKGALANRLVERALAARLDDGGDHRPWSWADFTPLARLEAPRLGVTRPVLSGAAGESLAFGLGHVDGTAPPGAGGNTVLAGHRDSWAGFLKDVKTGDELILHLHERALRYTVEYMMIVDAAEISPLDPTGSDRLTLITCHPIGGLLSTRERLVVICRRVRLVSARSA